MANTPKKPPLSIVKATHPNPGNKSATNTERTRHKSAPTHNGLTDKQEHFAQLVANGSNYSQSYRAAYNADNMSDSSIWSSAFELSRHPKVSVRIAQLIEEKNEENSARQATRAARITSFLEKMVDNEKASDAARLRAADLLGKTIGLYVDRQETSTLRDKSVDELEARLKELLDRKPKAV